MKEEFANINNLPQVKPFKTELKDLTSQLLVFELLKIFSIPMDIFSLNRTLLTESMSLTSAVASSLIYLNESSGKVNYIQKSNGAFEKKRTLPEFYYSAESPVFAEACDPFVSAESKSENKFIVLSPFRFAGRKICILELFFKKKPPEQKIKEIYKSLTIFEKCASLAIINCLIKARGFEISKKSFYDGLDANGFKELRISLSRATFASYVNSVSGLLMACCPAEYCSILWHDRHNMNYRVVGENTASANLEHQVAEDFNRLSLRLLEEAITKRQIVTETLALGQKPDLKSGAVRLKNYIAVPIMNLGQQAGGVIVINKLAQLNAHEDAGFNYNDQMLALIITNYLGAFYDNFAETAVLENKLRSLSIIYSLANIGNNFFDSMDFDRSIEKVLGEVAVFMKIFCCALVLYDEQDEKPKAYSSLGHDISVPLVELVNSINMDFWSESRNSRPLDEPKGINLFNLNDIKIFSRPIEAFNVSVNAILATDHAFDINVKTVYYIKKIAGYMFFITPASEREAACPFVLSESESAAIEFMAAAANIITSMIVAQKNYQRLTKFEKLASRMERLAALGEVAAGVAHEIRNPLGGISLFASSISSTLPKGDNRIKWLSQITEAVGRISDMVSKLLDYSREEIIAKKEVNFSSLLKECALFTQKDAERFGINVSTSFLGNISGKKIVEINRGDFLDANKNYIYCDIEKIRQVLINLILNSVNAFSKMKSDAAGNERENIIEFLCFYDAGADQSVIFACDNGPGIADEIKDRIFRPFFTTRSKGTGLGLAITQKIIEAHGGTIRLINKGEYESNDVLKIYNAIFEIRLPNENKICYNNYTLNA